MSILVEPEPMAPPAPKRRRPNEDALRKPFKSPFHSPLQPATKSTEASGQHTQTHHSSSDNRISLGSNENVKVNPTSGLPKLHVSKSRSSLANRPSGSVTLTTQIAELRQTINDLEQASSLLSSNKSARLEALIVTWRSASRAAAEELFAISGERISKMGGVGAWRAQERERAEFQQQWNHDEPGRPSDGCEGDAGEFDEREKQDYDLGQDLSDHDDTAEEEQKRKGGFVEESEDDVSREVRLSSCDTS